MTFKVGDVVQFDLSIPDAKEYVQYHYRWGHSPFVITEIRRRMDGEPYAIWDCSNSGHCCPGALYKHLMFAEGPW